MHLEYKIYFVATNTMTIKLFEWFVLALLIIMLENLYDCMFQVYIEVSRSICLYYEKCACRIQ